MNVHAILGSYLLLVPCALSAHEYWLDPINSSIARGSSAIIDVRNGDNFTGSAIPYDKSNFQAITINGKTDSKPYQGRLGDYPAIHPEFNEDGLYSINVETTAKQLTYKSREQLNTFLEYHALEGIKDQHTQRTLVTTNISERYFRSAKTLIQVSGTGKPSLTDSVAIDTTNHKAFSASGAVFELVLLNNPYNDTDKVRIKLLYQSKPLSGRQVEMFWKGSTLLRLTAVTNEDGIATFKLLGGGDYLINSVNVVEPASDDVDLLSYWGSITFER